MRMRDDETLYQVVGQAISQFTCPTDIEISPEIIAIRCCEIIDPDSLTPPLGTQAINLYFRQLARQELAKNLDPEISVKSMNDEQLDLFGRTLQDMYPAHRQGRKVYVRREYLTRDEWVYNENRLLKEGEAKIKHGGLLRIERESLERIGHFDQRIAR